MDIAVGSLTFGFLLFLYTYFFCVFFLQAVEVDC